MSTLNANSTRAQVLAAYADNASYEEDGSVAKCRAFVTAVRLLLSPKHLVSRAAHGGRSGEEVEIDLAILQQELQHAREWLAAAGAAEDGSSIIHADFSGFRE
jgi:hypothetical protein